MIAMASIAKHPLHPMLIPLPIGMWIFSFAADILLLGTGNPLWSFAAFCSMAGGVIGALVAALPGLLDLFTMNPSFTKRLGIWHMGINLLVVVLYVINVVWRRGAEPGAAGPFVLSLVAILFLGGVRMARWRIGLRPRRGGGAGGQTEAVISGI